MNSPVQHRQFDGIRPDGLWSLWDMLKTLSAKYLIELGQEFEELSTVYHLAQETPESPLTADERGTVQAHLEKVWVLCTELGLKVAAELVSSRTDLAMLPKTQGEFDMLRDAVMADLKGKRFVYISPDRADYFDNPKIVSEAARQAFKTAYREIVSAGNCYALDEPTAAVFHTMRAVEVGIRAMAVQLGVAFAYPIDLAGVGKLIGEIEAKVNVFNQPPKSAQKDTDLKFYSEALSQCRHFNNGWRIRVDHARENYKASEAREVIDHVRAFFEILAIRLKEPQPS